MALQSIRTIHTSLKRQFYGYLPQLLYITNILISNPTKRSISLREASLLDPLPAVMGTGPSLYEHSEHDNLRKNVGSHLASVQIKQGFPKGYN